MWKVAVILFADVPADGVPLPDPVMDHQHIHFALGAFVVPRREALMRSVSRLVAASVNRRSVSGDTSATGSGRKADGLFQRRQVHVDFLRQQSRQIA